MPSSYRPPARNSAAQIPSAAQVAVRLGQLSVRDGVNPTNPLDAAAMEHKIDLSGVTCLVAMDGLFGYERTGHRGSSADRA